MENEEADEEAIGKRSVCNVGTVLISASMPNSAMSRFVVALVVAISGAISMDASKRDSVSDWRVRNLPAYTLNAFICQKTLLVGVSVFRSSQ